MMLTKIKRGHIKKLGVHNVNLFGVFLQKQIGVFINKNLGVNTFGVKCFGVITSRLGLISVSDVPVLPSVHLLAFLHLASCILLVVVVWYVPTYLSGVPREDPTLAILCPVHCILQMY